MIYKMKLYFFQKNHLCIVYCIAVYVILSLAQISKILVWTYLEIVVVSWILLSHLELTMANIKMFLLHQFLLIPYSVLIVVINGNITNTVVIFVIYYYYYY